MKDSASCSIFIYKTVISFDKKTFYQRELLSSKIMSNRKTIYHIVVRHHDIIHFENIRPRIKSFKMYAFCLFCDVMISRLLIRCGLHMSLTTTETQLHDSKDDDIDNILIPMR
jgi:hypothetical protein